MSDITPTPDPVEDPLVAEAIARAGESLDRIEQRRKEQYERRKEELKQTQELTKSAELRKVVGRALEPRLAEIAKASDEGLARIDADGKTFAEAMKKARAVLKPRKPKRSIA